MKKEIPMPKFEKQTDFKWDIPKIYKKGMLVPGRVYASKKLLNEMDLAVYDQLANVASLPGIRKHALCMPDAHSGYVAPIGSVLVTKSVIVPAWIGYDICCCLIAVQFKGKNLLSK